MQESLANNVVTEFSQPFSLLNQSPVVWLVVSSFCNDPEITRLLEDVQNLPARLFDRVLVIDSLGTGAVPTLIARRGWQNVSYHSYGRNLGSAGNLALRLQLAAEGGADFAYALNHDGQVHPEVVRCLLKHAIRLHRVGAVYPISYLRSAAAYNLTGTRELPLPAKLVEQKPQRELIEAYWSSSNGALYALEPVRHGVLPWPELWMGWEDLEYGWRLADHGYRQAIACDAVFDDNYEYAVRVSLVRKFRVVSKPAWTTYYMSRNLLLITRRTRPLLKFEVIVILRILLESALILLVRPDKRARLRCLVRGVIDGLRNRTGKWILPRDPVSNW
jgi:GT2 family glycosyltransferase